MKLFKKVAIFFASSFILAIGVIWCITYHPKEVEVEAVYNADDAPLLKPGQEVKVMSWNVQYMAGKDYVFFYDLPSFDGPDYEPRVEDVVMTFKEVVRVIEDEDPDIILLQEVDHGARRTQYVDQLALLVELMPNSYKSYSSSFYWKNKYVPHPAIMGSTGMKLAVISKYRIAESTRHRLACVPRNLLYWAFGL